MGTGKAIPGLSIERKRGAPLQTQLYQGIRKAVLQGRLQAGDRIPSTREVADFYGISRTTSRLVYEQLIDEGYLEGQRGAGTRISKKLPDVIELLPARERKKVDRPSPAGNLSKRGILLGKTPVTVARTFVELRPFRAWLPSFRDFPLELWGRLARRAWAQASERSLKYGGPQGMRALREAIAMHVAQERGVSCSSEQVLIVAGSQEALFLSALVLGDPGDRVAMEDPGYLGARGAFVAAGLDPLPIPVGSEGIEIAALRKATSSRLVFVTPSHQYPLGVTMSLPRRLDLLRWAGENGAYVLEDDYDSEIRYTGRAVPALKALDREGRVIYVGSFSKVLVPSIRLGYLIVPAELTDAFLRARALIDRGSPSLEQATLCSFMEEGHFERHLRRMRKLYRERQEILLSELEAKKVEGFEVSPSAIGMHLVGRLASGLSAERVSERGEELGLELTPLSRFAFGRGCPNGIMLGYTALTPNSIREGVHKLQRCLKEILRESKKAP